MLPVRIAFDPDLPVVAAQAFTTGGRAFADGEAFPWRELGIDAGTVYAMWTSGLVRCEPVSAAVAEQPIPAARPPQPARRAGR